MSTVRTHPECKNGCAYARDIGMLGYSCANGCMYQQATLSALRHSKAVRDARHRENIREVGRENVAEFRERVEGRDLEDWHRDTDT